MSRMWIERREKDNGAEGEERRVHCVSFCVMQEGEHWPGTAPVDRNLRPVIEAEYWPARASSRHEATVSWPTTSDKRPELAYLLGHALQFAALEARTGQVAVVFLYGARFEPEPALPALPVAS